MSQSHATSPVSVDSRIPFCRSVITPEAQEAALRTLASGWITTGPEVGEFEREFAAEIGAGHAVAISSCTAAIEIALLAMRLPAGAQVLTSTMTFCGVAHAIVRAGLTPVLVDVNPDTLMPDEETTAEAIRRFGPVEAMVALHFAGHPAPVEEMAAAAGLPLERVVEDAAHALGTTMRGTAVGSTSAATCFSFYATKNLPIGEGGMLTTDDPEVAAAARRLRLHGMTADAWRRYLPGAASWRYEVDVPGLKANMTDVQAAIGRAQLRHFSGWQRRREELAAAFDARLSAVPGVRLPARPADDAHAWHLYVIQVREDLGIDRDAFIADLAQRGIDCSVHFIPLHHQPYFQRLLGAGLDGAFPNADAVFPCIVSLPLYPALGDDEVQRVCDAVAEVAALA